MVQLKEKKLLSLFCDHLRMLQNAQKCFSLFQAIKSFQTVPNN